MPTTNQTQKARAARPAELRPVVTKVRRVDHRDGAGHLDAFYQARLNARISEHAHKPRDRAFVSGTWSADPSVEESAEEFVLTVTSGEDGGESMLDEVATEESGGPFVETSATTEFAYGSDRTNPIGATREPFPTS
jgi:hypothetical protein